MKIHSIKLYNPTFGIKMSKTVERGFDNLEYKIRKKFGDSSNENIIKDYILCYIKKHRQDLTLDYCFDTFSGKNLCNEISQKPYTFILKDRKNCPVKIPVDFNRANLEEDLYTPSNLVILAQNIEALSKKSL